jgi:hypothetical protein
MKIQYIFAALSALVITMAGCSSGGQTGAWGAFENGEWGNFPVSDTSCDLVSFEISPTPNGPYYAGTISYGSTTGTVSFPSFSSVTLPNGLYYVRFKTTGSYIQSQGDFPLTSGASSVYLSNAASLAVTVYSQEWADNVANTGIGTGASKTYTVILPTSTGPVITEFKFLQALNSGGNLLYDCIGDIDSTVSPGTIDVWLPVGTTMSKLTPTFSVSAGIVSVGTTTQESGITMMDFSSAAVDYTVTDGSSTRIYTVLVTDVALSNLSVGGTMVESSTAVKRAYTATVPVSSTLITIGYTKGTIEDIVTAKSNATPSVVDNDNAMLTSSVEVELNGTNATEMVNISVDRTNSLTKNYAITVTKD